jgi:hypothetical protein
VERIGPGCVLSVMAKKNHRRGISRELRVATDVARLLPASVLAQLEAVVDDPDNVCCVCEELIGGPFADVAVFADGKFALACGRPRTRRSGLLAMPAMRIGGERYFAVQTVLRQQPVDSVLADTDFLSNDEPVLIRAVEGVGCKTVALHREAGASFRAPIRSARLTVHAGDLTSSPHGELAGKARRPAVSAHGLRNQKREQNAGRDEPLHGPEDTSRAGVMA